MRDYHVEWPRADRSIRKSPSFLQSLEPWRFERRVTHSPRLSARLCVEALRFRAMRVARIIAA
eukprot:5932119-Prymnesium_polylepis.1